MTARSSKPRPEVPEGPYLVVGLARSGAAAARVLAGRGGQVAGCDAGSPAEAAGLAADGVEVHLDTDGLELLDRARCLVKSPGVPREAPVVARARERGITVVGELELGWRLLPMPFVGVTGTNGKTTVTELLGHVWRTAGRPVAVAGNVGTPLASVVGEASGEATIVCECSSFQLEDAEAFAPECAILLNATPDHLDRHGDFDAYVEAKLRIFEHQLAGDVAVLDQEDPALAGRAIGGRARRVSPESARAVVERSGLALPGAHNRRNAMAAAAAAIAMGVEADAVGEALRSFPGVPHRLERVAEAGGVLYVNDSKATNVAAAAAALRAFERPVRAILGGSLKGAGFEGLARPVRERCVAAYLMGEAAEAIEDALNGRVGEVSVRRFAGLEAALAAAAAEAEEGDVVLLAPACASFDAYRDFEERGEHFRALVGGLAK